VVRFFTGAKIEGKVNMAKVKNSACDESLQSYFTQIKNIPLLTCEEELELSRLIQSGDKNARRRFIEANLRLVVKIALSYNRPTMKFRPKWRSIPPESRKFAG